jgi:putative serine protease PepD
MLIGIAVGGGVAAVLGLFVIFMVNRGGGEDSGPAPTPVVTQPAVTTPVVPVQSAPAVTPPPIMTASTTPAHAAPAALPTDAPATLGPQVTSVNASPAGSSEGTPPAPSGNVTLTLPDLVEQTDPSIVRINVKSPRGDSLGSGFVVSDTGTVVTNYHVIEGGQTVTAQFEDGRECGVLGFRLCDEKRDIAIIQLDDKGKPFIPIVLAKSLPRKGEEVAAFGAPLGLSFTATKGTISNIRAGKEMGMAGTHYVQTDASISGGNSGGPLVTMGGEVIGMNTFQYRDGQNLNFAVSIVDIREVLAASEKQPVTQITPQSVPSRRQELPTAMVDISGTERADKLLAQIKEASIFIKPFEIDPTNRINNYMFDKFEKTVKTRLKMDLTRIDKLGVNESVIILGVMWSPPEDRKLQSRGASQMSLELVVVMLDLTKDGVRQPSIVWKEEAKLATLSLEALAQGNLTKSVTDGTQKFFDKFVLVVNKARKTSGSTP